jgi:hypothetical protein
MNIIQFSEADELLDIRYDFVFKAVFTRNSEASKMALSDLISALIERTVKVETITANEPPVEGTNDRRVRFDISCKAERVIEKPAGEMAAQEAWAAFFRYLTDKGKRGKINEILKNEGGIAMAGEALIHISRDEIERARQLSEEKYILDTQDMKTRALRQGRTEGKIEVARKMKARGCPIAEIIEDTGLTLEAVEKL